MKDYNGDERVDKEDYQIFEELNNAEPSGNTTIPLLVVVVVVVLIFLYFKFV